MPMKNRVCYLHFQSCRRSTGFTLAELLVTLAILGIIAALAVPGFSNAIARARVRDATENIHGLIIQAKNESAIRDVNLSVTVQADHWCVGIASFPACDCTPDPETNACALEVAGATVLQAVSGDEFPGVTITENFPALGTTFNRLRKTASPAGAIAISASGQTLEIKVGLTGRVRVCAPEGSAFPGYPAC